MKIIAAMLGATLIASGAYAQSTSQSPTTMAAAEKADAKADMRVEKHIQGLHEKLKITPAEESQWSAVAKAMRDNVADMDRVIDKRESNVGNATAIDDLNAYGDIAQAHADGVKRLSAAFSPLYAAMSSDQKKEADMVFSRHAKHHMH
jgi:hypothetical protein